MFAYYNLTYMYIYGNKHYYYYKVKQWLPNQESFSLHKPLCRAFCHLKVIIGGLNNQYKVDLADVPKS